MSATGNFDPEEFGELRARVKNVEDEAIHARKDRAKLFDAINSVASNQAVMNDKLDRNHETLTKFVMQCGTCRIDMQALTSRVSGLEKSNDTTVIKRKASEPRTHPALEKKLWNKPLGEWMFDILVGALKVVGTAAIVYLIINGVSHAQP